MLKVVVIDPQDNVATALEDIRSGEQIKLDLAGKVTLLPVTQDIPIGHKVAVAFISCGDQVIKYGQPIGTATQSVQPGQHVHVHNLISNRGRGDV